MPAPLLLQHPLPRSGRSWISFGSSRTRPAAGLLAPFRIERLPVTRVRRPLAAPDQRYVAKRETSRLLEPAEGNVLDERQDVALEAGEVNQLPVRFVPLPSLLLASDVRLCSACCGSGAMRGIRPAAFFCSIATSPEPWNACSYCSR